MAQAQTESADQLSNV